MKNKIGLFFKLYSTFPLPHTNMPENNAPK
jgi:hypothetical protein